MIIPWHINQQIVFQSKNQEICVSSLCPNLFIHIFTHIFSTIEVKYPRANKNPQKMQETKASPKCHRSLPPFFLLLLSLDISKNLQNGKVNKSTPPLYQQVSMSITGLYRVPKDICKNNIFSNNQFFTIRKKKVIITLITLLNLLCRNILFIKATSP